MPKARRDPHAKLIADPLGIDPCTPSSVLVSDPGCKSQAARLGKSSRIASPLVKEQVDQARPPPAYKAAAFGCRKRSLAASAGMVASAGMRRALLPQGGGVRRAHPRPPGAHRLAATSRGSRAATTLSCALIVLSTTYGVTAARGRSDELIANAHCKATAVKTPPSAQRSAQPR